MASKSFMTPKERYSVSLLLRDHTKPVPGRDGLVIYDEGWNDERIATEVGGGATVKGVSNFRRSTVGDLISSGKSSAKATLADLVRQHNALCDSLDAKQFKVVA